jgi:SAM-dependent methyltransferase
MIVEASTQESAHFPAARWPEWHCPEHGGALTVQPEGNESGLACAAGHVIPCVRGIPRFVSGETYADLFGAQWNRFPKTQLDSYTGKPITRDRVRRCLGETLWRSLAGQQVLECGCGAGRFTEILLAEGAHVTSIDLSSAVDANARNFPIGPRHRIAQADIMKLPFARESFDIVFCLGVIQHTPSSEATIEALSRFVAPGGWLIIDHYTYTVGWYTKTAPLFRAWLKRLPAERAARITERLVDVLLPWHKRVANVPIARSIVHRLSPVLSFYVLYPELDDRLQHEWALLDTHDSLTDWYKHFRTVGQIRGTLEQLGFADVWCERGGNGVEARGRRPTST